MIGLPVNYGLLVFPTFQALDAFGTMDILNLLSLNFPMNLSVIARTLEPVSTQSNDPSLNPLKSNFGESVVPTHTFANAPPLDVLIIPGGYGLQADDLGPLYDFVRRTYPSLKYLMTICNGSWVAARAGVLDGRRATSNKQGWAITKEVGPKVNWVPHARWVVDGNIWTSSGVTAGIDSALAYVQEVYGEEHAKRIANEMEYERHEDPSWDPFAGVYNLPKENE
ncbi:class I glutamine amidotransferase-like protein [Lentinula guzmanii]|uniref:Class I glutamine amidotransferase-like protein n=2 Tax=Lentinula TaxID=5352 RepID=A0AA38JMN7_9AGAR|nr:class I glutamine amidotransferase-like protein [Lentinula guzmanii]KAJ3786777.1 class I glutamine amidotransferase-like protein [Lentinula aff. detonsa]